MEVHDIVPEAMNKIIPKKKKCKKAKWLSEEGLQKHKKRSKRQRRKGKNTHLKAEFQRIAGEIRKPSSVFNEKK